MLRRSIALACLLSLLILPLPGKARAQELPGDGAPLMLARNAGPILWYVDNPEIRQRMENDLELLRLWNQAVAAKRERKALGLALFTPGMILIGVGFAAALFQNAIGWWDEDTGDYIMIGGFGLGFGLAAPGIYFTMAKSKAEKAYEQYVHDTYGVTPIIQLDPRRNQFLAGFRLTF